MYFILYRSSCGIIRTALSNASKKVDNDQYATAQGSCVGFFESKGPVRCLKKNLLRYEEPLSTAFLNTAVTSE